MTLTQLSPLRSSLKYWNWNWHNCKYQNEQLHTVEFHSMSHGINHDLLLPCNIFLSWMSGPVKRPTVPERATYIIKNFNLLWILEPFQTGMFDRENFHLRTRTPPDRLLLKKFYKNNKIACLLLAKILNYQFPKYR